MVIHSVAIQIDDRPLVLPRVVPKSHLEGHDIHQEGGNGLLGASAAGLHDVPAIILRAAASIRHAVRLVRQANAMDFIALEPKHISVLVVAVSLLVVQLLVTLQGVCRAHSESQALRRLEILLDDNRLDLQPLQAEQKST